MGNEYEDELEAELASVMFGSTDTETETEEVEEETFVEDETPGEESDDEGEAELEEEPREEAEDEIEVQAETDFTLWAKNKYGEDVDLEKLAKATYNQEQLLGRKAAEFEAEQQARRELEQQMILDTLNTNYAGLSPEEDEWVDEAVMSESPLDWAISALQNDRVDLYNTVLNRFGMQGEREQQLASEIRARVLFEAQRQPEPQASYQEVLASMLNYTFQGLGMDINTHGPVVAEQAAALGGSHPLVQAMQSEDDNLRALAVQQIYERAGNSKTTVQKAVYDDMNGAKAREAELRAGAAGVNSGSGPRKSPKAKSFFDAWDEAAADLRVDGNNPRYGLD
jgi:ribosomal protein S24E